jgi:GAF domain-containing protein
VTTEQQDERVAEVAAALVERVDDGPDDLAEALSEMSRLLVGEEPLAAVLRRVAELSVAAVPGCSGAGVTLVQDDRAVTAAHTDDRVLAVDRQQYDVDDGPCLDAIRSRRTNRVDVDGAEQRWPEFAARARELGIHSFLAAPLVAGGQAVGSLNLYGAAPDAFDALDDALVAVFCSQASVALANARVYDRALTLNEQLTSALESRVVIEQAKGVLMGRHGWSADEAFDELRRRSQERNRKLREVAAEVVSAVPRQRG